MKRLLIAAFFLILASSAAQALVPYPTYYLTLDWVQQKITTATPSMVVRYRSDFELGYDTYTKSMASIPKYVILKCTGTAQALRFEGTPGYIALFIGTFEGWSSSSSYTLLAATATYSVSAGTAVYSVDAGTLDGRDYLFFLPMSSGTNIDSLFASAFISTATLDAAVKSLNLSSATLEGYVLDLQNSTGTLEGFYDSLKLSTATLEAICLDLRLSTGTLEAFTLSLFGSTATLDAGKMDKTALTPLNMGGFTIFTSSRIVMVGEGAGIQWNEGGFSTAPVGGTGGGGGGGSATSSMTYTFPLGVADWAGSTPTVTGLMPSYINYPIWRTPSEYEFIAVLLYTVNYSTCDAMNARIFYSTPTVDTTMSPWQELASLALAANSRDGTLTGISATLPAGTLVCALIDEGQMTGIAYRASMDLYYLKDDDEK